MQVRCQRFSEGLSVERQGPQSEFSTSSTPIGKNEFVLLSITGGNYAHICEDRYSTGPAMKQEGEKEAKNEDVVFANKNVSKSLSKRDSVETAIIRTIRRFYSAALRQKRTLWIQVARQSFAVRMRLFGFPDFTQTCVR